MMLRFIPRAGVPVRDPRLTPVQGGQFCYLTEPLDLEETDRVALQLLRHVRRGELKPGNKLTAMLAGLVWTADEERDS
jgi:hypothetical protein